MNDRYLYRAKRMGNEEWVQGYLFDDGLPIPKRIFVGGLIIDKYNGTSDDKWNINGIDFDEIDPSTICQCCGYKGIYEHDIFECDGETYEIVFDQDELAWFACGYGYRIQLAEFKPDEIIVIGNSFDNPELLEV